MVSRAYLSVVVALSAGVWAGCLVFFEGWRLSLSFFKPYSLSILLLTLALTAWDRVLWRFSWFYPWAIQRPDLNGTWKGTLRPIWKDPATGEPRPPISVYLVVRQTFSTLRLVLLTEESRSESVASRVVEEDGEVAIVDTYRNDPELRFRDRSGIHYGSVMLRVHGHPPAEMRGRYWTDRGTLGELELRQTSRRLASSYDKAALLSRGSGPVIGADASR